MGKILSAVIIPVHAAKPLTLYRYEEGSTTIHIGESQQEYGVMRDVGENPLNGKGAPPNGVKK